MKTLRNIALLLLALICFVPSSSAQGMLGIGQSGITGLPDTTYWGDTIRNMQVWVVNRGASAVSGLTVQLLALPNLTGSPIAIGTLDLTLGILQPGDSASVPLDYFVVSPSNSNNGSNIMVIWPTGPGTTPSDSAHQDYWVDSPNGIPAPDKGSWELTVFPNPCQGSLSVFLPKTIKGTAEISIFDRSGSRVLRHAIHGRETTDLSGLTNGLYFYQIESLGKVIASGKLILATD